MQRNRIQHSLKVKCRGKKPNGAPVFSKGLEVTIQGNVYPDGTFSQIVVQPGDCPHCGGGHSEYCLANGEKVKGLFCPFSFDFPWVQESKPDWKVPPEIQSLMTTCLVSLKP